MKLISIIIPVYNAENTLTRCLNSILSGSYQNIEIIAINDASSDRSGDILQQMAATEPRLKVLHQPENRGPGAARNLGLEHCMGEYIASCDADDYVEPMWLEHQYDTLTRHNADVAVCRTIIENGRPRQPQSYQTELYNQQEARAAFLEHRKLNGIMWNKLFKASVIKDKRVPEGICYFEDETLIWQALADVQTLVRTPYPDYHFVIHETSTLGRPINNKRIQDILKVWGLIHEDCLSLYPHHAEAARQRQLLCALGSATLLFRRGLTAELMPGYRLLQKTVRASGWWGWRRTHCIKDKVLFLALWTGIRIPAFVYRLKG